MRAAQMREVIQERLALLEQSNLLRSTGGNLDAARAVELMDTGKEKMDRLRGIADAMEGEERRLLVDRLARGRYSGTQGPLYIGLGERVGPTAHRVHVPILRARARIAADRGADGGALASSRVEVERKAAEIQELNESLERRVQQRTAELEVTNRELEATNRELEAFSYSVSHDLRAPLRTIDGFSLALEEDYAAVVEAEGKDYIGRVRAAVQRMGGLIDALLQLSRITRAEIERETVN